MTEGNRCPTCNGTGRVEDPDAASCENPWVTCPDCHGTGTKEAHLVGAEMEDIDGQVISVRLSLLRSFRGDIFSIELAYHDQPFEVWIGKATLNGKSVEMSALLNWMMTTKAKMIGVRMRYGKNLYVPVQAADFHELGAG